MKKKLILTILSVFILFGIIFGKTSFAYELTYKIKPELLENGNTKNFIYRTYTTASKTFTVPKFANNEGAFKTKTYFWDEDFAWVGWVYRPASATPGLGTFTTEKQRFHKEKTGVYGTGTASGRTYWYTTGMVTDPSILQPKGVTTKSSSYGQLGASTSAGIDMRIPEQEEKMTLLASGIGSGYKDGYQPYINEWNPTGAGVEKIYVTDHYVTPEQILELRKFMGTSNEVYVSNITKTFSGKNVYPLHYSAKSLMDAKYWSHSEYGTNVNDQKAFGSLINLYDNTLQFPIKGKRTVLVRHINLGTNTEISTEIINAAPKFTGNSTAILTYANGNINTSSGNNGIVWSNTQGYLDFQEVYSSTNNFVSTDDGIKINILQGPEYKCIGSNQASNPDFNTVQNAINNKIADKKHDGLGNASSVFVRPSNSDVDDFVWVDIYYSKTVVPKRNVLIRHIDLKTDREISTSIINPPSTFTGNSTAILTYANGNINTSSGNNGVVTSNRTGYTDFQEVYADNGSTNNFVKTSDGMKISILTKSGYECIGSNQDAYTSFDTAKASRNNKISGNVMDVLTNSTTVFVPPSNSNQNDFVLVDLYYSRIVIPPTPVRTILVRYINLGNDLKPSTAKCVTSPIFLNAAAEGQRTLSPTNQVLNSQNNLYPEFQEVWVIPKDETMRITAKTLAGYTYKGYIAEGDYNSDYVTAFNETLQKRNTKIASQTYTYEGTDQFKNLDPRTDLNKYFFGMIDFYYSEDVIPQSPPTIPIPPLLGTIRYAKGGSSPFEYSDFDKAVVPSGESITIGAEGAYKYMLGGIEIRKNELYKENTYTINHKVTSSGKFSYTYWKTDHETFSTYPGSSVNYNEDVKVACSDPLATEPCYENKPVAHNVTAVPAEADIQEGTEKVFEQNLDHTYTVPIKYTYYTVPNMRIFTINKLELYNKNVPDSGGSGLPFLFKSGIADNSDYTLYPTTGYKTSVKANIKGLAGTQLNSSNILNESNYISVNKTGVNVWNDNIIRQTYDTYSSSDYATALDKAVLDIKGQIQNRISGATNSDVADATNSKVKYKVQNTSIDIDGNKIIVDPKKIEPEIELKHFNSTGTTFDPNYTIAVKDLKQYLNFATDYPNNTSTRISSHYYPDFSKTAINTWGNNIFDVPLLRFNGDRNLTAKIEYKVNSENTINTTGNEFTDNEMKNITGVHSSVDSIVDDMIVDGPKTGAFSDRIQMYTEPGIRERQVQIANVFTPVAATCVINPLSTSTDAIIDHTVGSIGVANNIIQKNARFKVTCNPNSHPFYGILSSSKINEYIKTYYLKFDFDVEEVYNGGTLYERGAIIPKDTWIGPISKSRNYIEAQAVRNPDTAQTDAVFGAESNNVTVMAIAKNIPTTPDLEYRIYKNLVAKNDFVTSPYNKLGESLGFNNINPAKMTYFGRTDLSSISNYAAEKVVTTKNLSRVFDFKVTDVKDIDWKDVFRKPVVDLTDNPNIHTGNIYYSGVTKWNLYSLRLNELNPRGYNEIGNTPKKTLPIGPYKNTNTEYVKAPKIGYRFAFDLKTTGKIISPSSTNRQIEIVPSFYYISKDATNLINDNYTTENPDKKIKLFYKNSSGRYVEVGSNSDIYKLSFVPKDGYRYIETGLYNFDDSLMSKSSVLLGSLKKLTIGKNMMALSNNNFVQTWYGEYKLPNSTIAVEVTKDVNGNEKYDINKPLKNGYIGVKFDITATVTENGDFKINYNKNNTGSSNNTTQWDYEGYMGFIGPGNVLTGVIKIPLENGIWSLSNLIYNQIKGTVILYDIDNRASSDFE